MQIIIAGRHVDVTDALKAHVEKRLSRLERFEPRVSRVEVTLSEEKTRCIVEALASVDRAEPLHGRAEAGDFRTAVDRVRDKLIRQLKKHRSRRRDHKAPRPQSVSGGDPE